MSAVSVRRPLRLAAPFAALALAAVIAPRAGQAQTITACSAAKSGSMYRVGITNAPSDCTSATHTKTTWNVQGPKGDPGAPGAPGISGYQTTYHEFMLGAHSATTAVVPCPSGTALGGGFWTYDPATIVRASAPLPGTGWQIRVENNGPLARKVQVHAVCATVAK